MSESPKIIDDGGPACPRPGYNDGLTMRDWFAGQAIAGLLARQHGDVLPGADTEYLGLRYPDGTLFGGAQAMAQDAYALADAMIAERQAAE